MTDELTSFVYEVYVFPNVKYNRIVLGDGEYSKILHGSRTVVSEARYLDESNLDSGL